MLNGIFFKQFPDELSCRAHLKQSREKEGIVCKNCGGVHHFWMENQAKWECYACKSRTNLKSGTMMQGSKLPLHAWYKCLHYMTSTKIVTLSAVQMMRNLNLTTYSAVWYMMHKIRISMGKQDAKYKLGGEMEIDDGYFEVVMYHNRVTETGVNVKVDKNEEKYVFPDKKKRGRGTEGKRAVMVMVESVPTKNTNPNKKDRQMGFVKMVAMDNLQEDSVAFEVANGVDTDSNVVTDKHPSYNVLKELVIGHKAEVVAPKEAMRKLPWVHTVIANAKRKFLGIYHSINDKYLQNYLDEFVYKLNRNDFQRDPFDGIFKVAIRGVWSD